MSTGKDNPIYVTRPNLPPMEKLLPFLEKIWDTKILTNIGPFHDRFEEALSAYLRVDHVNLFTNGTIALIVGLQSLRITGEVITTPYSFVATTHALKWNGITPVFCDIEPKTLTIDPDRIEALITPKTTAILPVHVYGHPCTTEKIQVIADKYGLKVIYDAAHAFGVRLAHKNLLLEGDMSILSFHGTKLFTTFEGGAIITSDLKLKQRIDFLKNFGFADEVTVIAPGINGKMNEFQAVMGLLGLDIVQQEIEDRKTVAHTYLEQLKMIHGIKTFTLPEEVTYNYSYFPVLIDETEFGVNRETVYEELKKHHIYARRYFYPLISDMPSYRSLASAAAENLPIARKVSGQVLCLPIYGTLGLDVVSEIATIIKSLGSMA